MVSELYKQYNEEIVASVVAGEERLDAVSDTWRERVQGDMLSMVDVGWCILSQAFGGYKEGLDFLGIDRGETYGFDIPDTIYDQQAQEEAYFLLENEWLNRLGA